MGQVTHIKEGAVAKIGRACGLMVEDQSNYDSIHGDVMKN